MKRILFIITKSDIGGAQNLLLHIVDYLKKHENHFYDVHVVVGGQGYLTEQLQALNISFSILPRLSNSFNIFNDILCIYQLKNIIKTVKPSLVHLHSTKAGWLGRITSALVGVSCVLTVHGWCFTNGVGVLKSFFGILVETFLKFFPCHVVTICKSDFELGRRFKLIDRNNYTLIYNGIKIKDNVHIKMHDNASLVRLVMVARFSNQKDHITLLKAIKIIKELKFSLDLYGDGETLDFCKRNTLDLEINHKVNFMGAVNDIQGILPLYDVFILSTKYEGLPLSILEAMNANLPIIATNTDGIPEQIENNVNGLLVQKSSEFELAEALALLISSPEIRYRFASSNHLILESKFSIDKMLAKYIDVYNKLI
ncbi:hypothetical protein BWI93_14480 [Siphonobacter sp. BAB-5385]|uniref:glycosyltransferase family 4 protein n=1 Tax=Siphonobacter sp. BAB-5385 TaxID=1864822 RepID=UPI000B9E313C|nr:glycosyltransferase family 4 protein [Siphonobacter sp. BAB-5385]OZI07537.1 hypothetical protein BWI93_14480 [Siphonobacter sp. BAB-5385]